MDNNIREMKKQELEALLQQTPNEIHAWAERTLQDTLNDPLIEERETDLTVLETQKELVARWNQKYDSINHQSCKVEAFRIRHPEQCVVLQGREIKPMLAGLVSEERLPYVYEVLTILMQLADQCGGWTDGNMVFMLLGIPVSFTVFESRAKKTFHPDTYKDRGCGGYRCRSRTFIKNKKLDLVWNGNLVMIMPDGKRINLKFDGDKPAKDPLTMARALFQSLWSYALKEMLQRKKEKERRRKQYKHDVLHNLEVSRLEILHRLMDDYDNAEKLRRVMELMRKQNYPQAMIQASREEADQLDPFVSRDKEVIEFFHLRDKPKQFPVVWKFEKATGQKETNYTEKLLLISHEEAVAQRIRSFAQYAITRKVCNRQWLRWALKKADWYDPLVRGKDKVLGLRQWGDPIVPNQVKVNSWKEIEELEQQLPIKLI